MNEKTNRRDNDCVSDSHNSIVGVKALLERFGQQLSDKDFKISVADYIRLMQVQRDLEQDEKKVVEIRWMDVHEETHSIEQ